MAACLLAPGGGWASSWTPRSLGLRSVTRLSGPVLVPTGAGQPSGPPAAPAQGRPWRRQAPSPFPVRRHLTDPSALPSDSYPSGTGHTAVASPGARCASGRPSHPRREGAVLSPRPCPPPGAPWGVTALLSLFSGGSSAPAARPSVAPDLHPARASISLPKAHRPSWPCPRSGWCPALTSTLPGGGPSSLPCLCQVSTHLAARGPSFQSRANPHLSWGKSEGADRDGYREEECASLREWAGGRSGEETPNQGPEPKK